MTIIKMLAHLLWSQGMSKIIFEGKLDRVRAQLLEYLRTIPAAAHTD